MSRLLPLTVVGLALTSCVPQDKSPGKGQVQPGNAGDPDDAPGEQPASCGDLPKADQLKTLLKQASDAGSVGGLNDGRFEWAAVVNRKGELCAVAFSNDDKATGWTGSQAIAKAKAYTANAFSSDLVPLSTARLYTLAQPGHSLFGAGAANPFNPLCLATPDDNTKGPKLCGGTIVFGGGVALYKGKTRVGALGASGDTACADHEMAKRMRDKLGMNPANGAAADDIIYTKADGPSPFAHPMCQNTWRNGKKLGEEAPASGY